MKYSIQKSIHSYVNFTYENGIKAYRSTPVELEFWERIQELEQEVIHWKSNHDNQVKLKSQLMDRPDLKDRAASIAKLNNKIAELEKEIQRLQRLQNAWEHVNLPNEVPISYTELLSKVEDLEAQKTILMETGHWIGQDEAYDLKVAVQKFLGYARTGTLTENGGVFTVPFWQIQELSVALNNCGPFKDYSLSSPPKQTMVNKTPYNQQKCYLEFFEAYVQGLPKFQVGWWDEKQDVWILEYGHIRTPRNVIRYWWPLDDKSAIIPQPKHTRQPQSHLNQTPPQEPEPVQVEPVP